MYEAFADIADESAAHKKYQLPITIEPGKLMAAHSNLPPLTWTSIPFGHAAINRVPNDKRGVYAFAISYPNRVLPPHGYILYIGIAGRKSDRSLRERYRDYLTESKVKKRVHIVRMIGYWESVLRFWFAPVDDAVTAEDLQNMERQLNAAFVPPFSITDIDAETRAWRRAFP